MKEWPQIESFPKGRPLIERTATKLNHFLGLPHLWQNGQKLNHSSRLPSHWKNCHKLNHSLGLLPLWKNCHKLNHSWRLPPHSKNCHKLNHFLGAAADTHDIHIRTQHNSKLTWILCHFSCVWAQSNATKCYLAVERPRVTHVERIGSVLFHSAFDSVVAIQWLTARTTDNSQCRLLTKWQTVQSSLIKKWWDKLTCIHLEFTPPCIDQCRIYIYLYIYTSINITTEVTAVVMGKGWDHKCAVVGQNSFASPTGGRSLEHCRSCVWSTVAGHSNTDVMTPVAWLWCHSSVRRLLCSQSFLCNWTRMILSHWVRLHLTNDTLG